MEREGSFRSIFIVMAISLAIAFFWQSFTPIRNTIHFLLDPTVGAMLNWNQTWGLLIAVFIIALITIILQKYTTDQESLRELKKEQKILQEEMKKYKDNPEKLMELQKKSFEFLPKTMKLSMRTVVYTGVPFVLLFRWFWDFFNAAGNPKFLGFLSWFWFYLIFSLVFNSILKKYLKVV
jgi:uncharacterized membrane protein (DUF106 family)